MAVSFVGVAVLLIEKPASGSGVHLGGRLNAAHGERGVFLLHDSDEKRCERLRQPHTERAGFGRGAILLIPFCAFLVEGCHGVICPRTRGTGWRIWWFLGR